MATERPIYPFSALVGQERLKRALVLNAINPRIGGVLIRGEKGTAKSTAVRGLARLLPSIDVVADDQYNSSPTNPAAEAFRRSGGTAFAVISSFITASSFGVTEWRRDHRGMGTSGSA